MAGEPITEPVLDSIEIRSVVQVGNDYMDRSSGPLRKTLRQRIEPFSVPGDEYQIVAPKCEAVGINRADAGRGARDQRCAL